MAKYRIEIVAVDGDEVWSVGAVEVFDSGDVYVILKQHRDFHWSRHASGELRTTSDGVSFKVRDGPPIDEFKGCESLGTFCFDCNFPPTSRIFKKRKRDGLFAFDLRPYRDSMFNMTVVILTEEGLPTLTTMWKWHKKRQVYLFTESHPMIGIIMVDATSIEEIKT